VRAKQERSQQEIVEAALRLLKSHPLADLTVNAVAREAQITPQSVHYYFRSREDLAAAVIEALGQRELESLLEQVNAAPNDLGALEVFVRALVTRYRDDLESFRAQHVWPQIQGRRFVYQLQTITPLSVAVMAKVGEKLQRAQADGKLRADLDPGAVGVLAWTFAYGVLARESILGVSKYPARYSIDDLLDTFFFLMRRALANGERRLDDAIPVA
jgi:AcrR family transcriptional regulator